jgi:hypothetical protein
VRKRTLARKARPNWGGRVSEMTDLDTERDILLWCILMMIGYAAGVGLVYFFRFK